jgi:hypothetical protein
MSEDPLKSVLSCNGCGQQLGQGDVMVCAACAAKTPKISVTYSSGKRRDTSHVVPGTCSCECHDTKLLHFAPCCSQTYQPRVQLKRLRDRGENPIKVADFSKSVYPVVRPEKGNHEGT